MRPGLLRLSRVSSSTQLRSPLALAAIGVASAFSAAFVTVVTESAAYAQGAPEPAQASDAPPNPSGGAPGGASGGPSGAPGAGVAESGESPAGNPEATPAKDQVQTTGKKEKDKKEESQLPFRGSSFVIDNSGTTSAAHLSGAQQSYVPTFETWLSLRPRWAFTKKLSYSLRADYYKEWTNSNDTTYRNEDVFGDIWNTLAYSTPLGESGGAKNTKVSVSGRVLLPTSKDSQANGVYVTAGAGVGISHKFEINGEDAKALNDARLGFSLLYSHAFSRATTATSSNLSYPREDLAGHSVVADQLRGTTLVNHSVTAVFDTGLTITPKLSLTLDYIVGNQWHYIPPSDVKVQTATGQVNVPRSSNDAQFTQSGWFLASVDYNLMDEVSLGLGYYNLTNVLAPDGTRRGVFSAQNVWWSPEARVFFDVTVSLDKVYERIAGKKNHEEAAKNPAQSPSQKTASRLRNFGQLQ